MTSGFAPEFLILLGVDIFLGASILTVLLDKHFPPALPYIMDAGALIGFGELVSGPSFIGSFSNELQFYYSFAYALISVLTLFAINLYLLFLSRRPFESAVVGVFATIPSGLGILYFTSAFVNGSTVSLPIVPVIPIEGVYALFGISVALIIFSLVMFGRHPKPAVERERPKEEPIPASASEGQSGIPLVVQAAEKSPSSIEFENLPTPKREEGRVLPSSLSPSTGSADTTRDVSTDMASQGIEASGQAAPEGVSAGPASVKASSGRDPGGPSAESKPSNLQSSASVLVLRDDRHEYKQRLVDSIRFFEKAVNHPVSINTGILPDALKGTRSAYLTPGGMVLTEDSSGKTSSRSLFDFSTDEALKIMREAMKGLEGKVGQKS